MREFRGHPLRLIALTGEDHYECATLPPDGNERLWPDDLLQLVGHGSRQLPSGTDADLQLLAVKIENVKDRNVLLARAGRTGGDTSPGRGGYLPHIELTL